MPKSESQIKKATEALKRENEKSQIKKATEALKRENEKLEAAKKKQDTEIADLLKKIKKAK